MRSSSEVTEEDHVSLFIFHIIREDITLNAFSVEVFSRSFARVMLSSAPTSYFFIGYRFFPETCRDYSFDSRQPVPRRCPVFRNYNMDR